MIKPKVTVLMPVYNTEKYLREAIDSILNQTFKDFEFLIINDASTDRTREILQSYHDPRIKVINNRKNLGLAKSLNKGLKIAKGKYIARMDADDISLPERLKKQIRFMEKNQSVGLLSSFWFSIDGQGKKIQVHQAFNGKHAVHFICHGSVMIRKDFLQRVSFYREVFEYSEDSDLWLRLSEVCDVRSLKEPLYKYRVHNESISSTKRAEQILYASLAIKMAEERKKFKKGKLSAISPREIRKIKDKMLKFSGIKKRRMVSHTYFIYGYAAFKLGNYKMAFGYLLNAIKIFAKFVIECTFSVLIQRVYSRSSYLRNKFWDKKAADRDFRWGRHTDDYSVISSIITQLNPQKILDIGCGSGRLFPLYHSLDIKKAIGQDISKSSLQIASQRYQYSNIKTVHSSIIDLNFPKLYFDLIISHRVLQHISPNQIKKIIEKLTKLGHYVYINELTNSDDLKETFYMFKHDYSMLFKQNNYTIVKKGKLGKQTWLLFAQKPT